MRSGWAGKGGPCARSMQAPGEGTLRRSRQKSRCRALPAPVVRLRRNAAACSALYSFALRAGRVRSDLDLVQVFVSGPGLVPVLSSIWPACPDRDLDAFKLPAQSSVNRGCRSITAGQAANRSSYLRRYALSDAAAGASRILLAELARREHAPTAGSCCSNQQLFDGVRVSSWAESQATSVLYCKWHPGSEAVLEAVSRPMSSLTSLGSGRCAAGDRICCWPSIFEDQAL